MILFLRKEDAEKIFNTRMKSRGYKLHDGDVFTINNTLIQYFKDVFYEVELKYGFEDSVNMIVKRYSRTGRIFTKEEMESMI